GVLRWRGRLDYVLQPFSKRSWAPLSPRVRNALRLTAYQIEVLMSVPPEAACDEGVRLVKAKEPWAGGFTNEVIRAFLRGRSSLRFPDPENQPESYLSAYYSHPQWLVRRWLERFSFQECAGLCAANNEIPPTSL